jgi:regulator of RNase E activity RraA
MNHDKPEIPLSSWRAARISAATIADVLNGFGVDGVLDTGLRAQNHRRYYAVGTAYTVQWAKVLKGENIMLPQSSTWDQVAPFLVPELQRADGLVYVSGAGPLLDEAALAGGLSCTYFDKMGFAAVVLGGAVRDIEELAALEIPVIASCLTPADTQGAYKVKETGTHCVINNKTVSTGDIVICDPNGVVVVPSGLAADVYERAEAIERLERSILQQVQEGVRLPDLIAQSGRI